MAAIARACWPVCRLRHRCARGDWNRGSDPLGADTPAQPHGDLCRYCQSGAAYAGNDRFGLRSSAKEVQ